jgi:hypothetical protein
MKRANHRRFWTVHLRSYCYGGLPQSKTLRDRDQPRAGSDTTCLSGCQRNQKARTTKRPEIAVAAALGRERL